MAIQTYLAMTAAECQSCEAFPEHIAWMACHFSPYGSGLSNLPPALPPGSLLILNDRIPIAGHDPDRIAKQLQMTVNQFRCRGLLLDFQRPCVEEIRHLIEGLLKALPCPVAVADIYAQAFGCPVFLSPCPHHVPLSEYIRPWKEREIWLDLAADAETILLSKSRCQITALPLGELPETGHRDTLLHCHYAIHTEPDFAEFILWRTAEDQEQLSKEAETLGIQNAISLFLETRL